jgi:hypothetical protein
MGAPTVLSLPSDEEWILNFYKLRSLAQQFKFIFRLQQLTDAPEWEGNMDLATCISAVSSFSDDEGYERSLKLEPRNITQAELYTMEHGPSVIAQPSQQQQFSIQQQLEDSSESSGGSSTSASSASSSSAPAATSGPIKVRPNLATFKHGSPDLEKFQEKGKYKKTICFFFFL